MPLDIVKTALTLRLEVPLSVLQARFGEAVRGLGAQLAQQAAAIAKQDRLGYFPALQFFAERSDVDQALVSAIIEAGGFARQHATHELRTRLRHAFSSIRVQRAQCLAFTLPSVRPHQAQAADRLARHYTPNALRIELLVTTLHKGGDIPEGDVQDAHARRRPGRPRAAAMDEFASRRAQWWLREAFETVEVIDVRSAGASL